MTERASVADVPARGTGAEQGRRLHTAAFAVLLTVVAARCFLGEMPFHRSNLDQVAAVPAPADTATKDAAADRPRYMLDRGELSRMTFSVLLLAAGGLWALGGVVAGKLRVRHGYLAVLIAVFAVVSLFSVGGASNRRAALNGWLEQVSLLAACFLAIQLCTSRRRFVLAAAVLAAVGATLALKGFEQLALEYPDRVEAFEGGAAQLLSAQGIEPNTPAARHFEARLRDRSVTAFFPLANPLASLLVVLLFAAVGLAAEKFRAALGSLRAGRATRRKGEVDLPTVAAVLAAVAAAAIAAAVVLTKSRGGMIAAAAGAAALAAGALFGGTLARHWRKCVLLAAAVFAAGAAAVVITGLRRDRLPTRTMTFRWYYWTASAEIIRDHPVRGVGPGNFAAAYLQVRRDEAEEEIQMPHNVIVHALTQYGAAGAACYLAILVCLLIGCARPGERAPPDEPGGAQSQPAKGVAVLAAVALGTLAARAAFSETADVALFFVEGVPVAAVLAGMLALAAWSGRDFSGITAADDAPRGGLLRAALGCGAAAFVLHNMVTYSFWVPAAAGAFYVAAGACVGRSRSRREWTLVIGRWLFAGAFAAALVAAVVLCWWPTLRKTISAAGMLSALERGDTDQAWRSAQQAAEADAIDPQAAADAAKAGIVHARSPRVRAGSRGRPTSKRTDIRVARKALEMSRRAVLLDSQNASSWQLAGNVAWAVVDLAYPRQGRYVAEGNTAYRKGEVAKAETSWSRAALYAPETRLRDLGPEVLARLLEPGPGAAWVVPVAELSDVAVWHLARAVELNPKAIRLRMNYARILCDKNRLGECLDELAEARRLDGCLLPDSFERLTPEELRKIEMLAARADFLLRRLWPRTRPATGPAN